jgi:hypothetical protein
MRSLTAAIAAALAVLAVSASAPADPVVRYHVCDHTGIESHTTKRHVNYLSTQGDCARAQHIAKLWVHSHSCGYSHCNVWEGHTAIAYFGYATRQDTEYTSKGHGSSIGYIIGWKKLP